MIFWLFESLFGWQGKVFVQIHDIGDLAAEVNDASDIGGRPWYGSYRYHFHNFADNVNIDRIPPVREGKLNYFN